MTAIQQKNAIRQRIYLAGMICERSPQSVQLTQKRFQVSTRTSNLGLRVDRAFTMAGMPNVRNRRELTLPWPTITEPPLLEHIDRLVAAGQPFGVGIWKQEYDVFDGDGDATTFYLQRRQLLPVLTPDAMPADYPTRVTVYDKSFLDPTATPDELDVVDKTAATIDTGDPASGEAWIETDGHQVGNIWVSKVRLGDPAPLASDCLIAAYLPLYTMVVDQEQPRSYAQALQEPRSLKLVEFG